MMTATNRRSINGRLTRATTFWLLAFAAVLYSAADARAQWATSGNNISNTNSGRVGIGTTDPAQGNTVDSKFTVASGDDITTAIATSNGTLPRFALNHRSNGSWTLHDYAGNKWNAGITQMSGNVGLGTTSPARVLDVQGAQGQVRLTTATHANGSVIELKSLSASPALIGAINFVNAADLANGQITYTASNAMTFATGGTEKMRLDASGNLTVNGNIAAKYQDVAEWVPSTQKLAAGTVVRLDPHRSNQVLASLSSYDTSVAGVVSAQPGIALGEAGEGKVLVATTGRVKVKVDATLAPIRIGDLLVTSDVAGVAMRSEPLVLGGRKMHAPGTIIGKALEPLAKGTGEILVLLSLQ